MRALTDKAALNGGFLSPFSTSESNDLFFFIANFYSSIIRSYFDREESKGSVLGSGFLVTRAEEILVVGLE